MTSRRTFVQAGAALAAASRVGAAAENPIKIAVVGCGGMMSNHIKLLIQNPAVQIVWACDVDQRQLARAMSIIEPAGQKPKTTGDMRQAFDDPAVKAVWIATPDHWHAPAAILAANAGKHVYVEKPCCHNLREGQLMRDAARRNKIVMQTGTQSRSSAHALEAMQRLRDGAIGEVLIAKAWNSQLRRDIGRQQPTDPPAELDFDAWVGPAPMRKYQSNLLPGIWRWWHDFGCGDMGNDGVHEIDIARWGLGVSTYPSRVTTLAGKYFFKDDQEFPDTMTCAFEFNAGSRTKQLIFEQRIWSPYFQQGYENGTAFYGESGYMIFGKAGGWQLYEKRDKLIEQKTGKPDLGAHHQNFLDCIKSGALPNADVEIGRQSAALCHLGNIAHRIGRQLTIDPQAETILNDADASQLTTRQYRPHWGTPQNS